MAEKNKGGRPPKLTADEKTLAIVKGLGNIQATSKECAAVLGVTEPTWIKFKKDNASVEDALRDGQGEGLASLRRRQFKAANDGNPTMLIWLGKQYLGQADKQEIAQTVDVQVTDARSRLESLIDRQITARTDQGGARRPH
ncbi:MULTISPECIES: hypothetical protein [unclassified Aurantimonas]|uniref:hypothetical protein n=1 Tax=unclassified Aurantimonas TaxID=2638230 RepID=UPI002E199450|nr:MULTISPECIES: hypothetical protein [unclassified Aurantimonas]MEC5289401.1 hypothetical protein [Aurantimonas sp. C2-3-R2]MEC5410481.1 hypothetical protein [Aurantimonas sp. C2-4-R8]